MSHPDTDPPCDGGAGGIPLFSARDNGAGPEGETVTNRPETAVGPDTRKFDLIQIPRSWEQVIALYGGDCTYQLVARDGKTHRFSAYSEKVYFASLPRKSPKKRRVR